MDWVWPRISGNFTGRTDEVFQWAALKWGLPDEILRAMAVAESYWHQGEVDERGQPVSGRGYGDFTENQSQCAPGYSIPCPQSFGILQIKHTAHPDTFSRSRDSTSFAVDYVAGVLRGCYEGWEVWLRDWGYKGRGEYTGGDVWGCVGRWYSGNWHTDDAEWYISTVRSHLENKPWLGGSF